MIVSNLNEVARQLTKIVTSRQLFIRGGMVLKEAIEDDFDTMLLQTPQYSGSTVASYRLGYMYETPTVHEVLPEPASAQEAFERGHQTAVNLARVANAGFFGDPNYEKMIRKDIIITNGAPQFETAEYGPVRMVNEPAHAVETFKNSLKSRLYPVDLGDL